MLDILPQWWEKTVITLPDIKLALTVLDSSAVNLKPSFLLGRCRRHLILTSQPSLLPYLSGMKRESEELPANWTASLRHLPLLTLQLYESSSSEASNLGGRYHIDNSTRSLAWLRDKIFIIPLWGKRAEQNESTGFGSPEVFFSFSLARIKSKLYLRNGVKCVSWLNLAFIMQFSKVLYWQYDIFKGPFLINKVQNHSLDYARRGV